MHKQRQFDFSGRSERQAAKPSLADPEVVDGLLRQFLASVLMVLNDVQTGMAHEDEGEPRVNALAKRYASMFLGETPDFTLEPWNSRYQLGNYIAAMTVPNMDEFDRPTDAFFAYLASVAIAVAQQEGQGELTPEESQEAIMVTFQDAKAVLLGMRAGARPV